MFSLNVDAFYRIEWLTFVETNGSLIVVTRNQWIEPGGRCFPLEVNLILKLVA